MGIKFEINIALGHINASTVPKAIPNLTITESHIIDNWAYENEKVFTKALPDDADSCVSQGKILLVYGTMNNERDCGFFLHRDNGLYMCNLFFDCVKEVTGSDIYSRAADHVIEKFADHGMIYAALGYEMLISEDRDISDRIHNSHGVFMWITKDKIFPPNSFEQIQRNGYTILTKKER